MSSGSGSGSGSAPAANSILSIDSSLDETLAAFSIYSSDARGARVRGFAETLGYESTRDLVSVVQICRAEFIKVLGSEFGQLNHGDRTSLLAFIETRFASHVGGSGSASSASGAATSTGSNAADSGSGISSGKKSVMKMLPDNDNRECYAPTTDALVNNMQKFQAYRRLADEQRYEILQGPHFNGEIKDWLSQMLELATKVDGAEPVEEVFQSAGLWSRVREFLVFTDPKKLEAFISFNFSHNEVHILELLDFHVFPPGMPRPRFDDIRVQTSNGKTIMKTCLENFQLSMRFVFSNSWKGAGDHLISDLNDQLGNLKFLGDAFVYHKLHAMLASFSTLVNKTKAVGEVTWHGPVKMLGEFNRRCALITWPPMASVEVSNWDAQVFPHLIFQSPRDPPVASGSHSTSETKSNKRKKKGEEDKVPKKQKDDPSSAFKVQIKAEQKGSSASSSGVAEAKLVAKSKTAPCSFLLATKLGMVGARSKKLVECTHPEQCTWRHFEDLSELTFSEANACLDRIRGDWVDDAKKKLKDRHDADPSSFKAESP